MCNYDQKQVFKSEKSVFFLGFGVKVKKIGVERAIFQRAIIFFFGYWSAVKCIFSDSLGHDDHFKVK